MEKFYCRGNPKFTDDDKVLMFDLNVNQNKRLKEIAEKFDCSTTIVHRYIKQIKRERQIN
jgi:transposase